MAKTLIEHKDNKIVMIKGKSKGINMENNIDDKKVSDNKSNEKYISELSKMGIDETEILLNNKKARVDHMKLWDDMEDIGTEILDEVISEMNAYDPDKYTEVDVLRALKKDELDIEGLRALLSKSAEKYLEEMAQRAKRDTQRYFGNSVTMFTPLYISNYCENYCIYCGFNCHNKINRLRLDDEMIEKELKVIAKSGLL